MMSFDSNDIFSGFSLPNAHEDGCTQCGMCLPSCPTYIESNDINQSPMGRIRLIRLLGEDKLESNMLENLENCLGCRTCEAVCPSKVNYSMMLDQALMKVRKTKALPFWHSMLLAISTRPLLLTAMVRVIKLTDGMRLRQLLSRIGLLRLVGLERFNEFLGYFHLSTSQVTNRSVYNRPELQVTLFRGCFSAVLEQDIQQSCVDMLNTLGIEVIIPNEQTCCGALHRHCGENEKALDLAKKNILSFSRESSIPVISTSSGCGAALREYAVWLDGSESATHFSDRYVDICRYFSDLLKRRNVILTPLDLKVAIHSPCSLQQNTDGSIAVMELLSLIPGLTLHQLSTRHCCGAGGHQALSNANMANGLRAHFLDEIKEIGADVLVSSNLGCSHHLGAGLRGAEQNIPVLHPIQLLHRSMEMKIIPSI